jgi:hypothetical protein
VTWRERKIVMIHPASTDIIELLKQLVNLLQLFAQSHGIMLAFNPKKRKNIYQTILKHAHKNYRAMNVVRRNESIIVAMQLDK